MFVLFTCMHFGCGKFYEDGQCVRQQPSKWSVIARSLRNDDFSTSRKEGLRMPIKETSGLLY
jgi:hypothetical protein